MDREHILIKFPKTTDEYERCVLCNEVTDVKRRLPIDARKYYIDGIGQLCRQCFLKINEPDADEEI